MATLLIPAALRSFTGGKGEIEETGNTAGEAIHALAAAYPDIAKHLYEDDGSRLRAFINVFVGETNIKKLNGLDTPITPTDTVMLVPAIAGGCIA
jgi:molybdopterin converting factor small subunit